MKNSMSDFDPDMADLERKLDLLIRRCEQLTKENAKLRSSESSWRGERTRLVEQHHQAQQQVGDMIKRLKLLDQE